MKEPIAILCSDLHLSLTPPACRADEDWLQTQAYYLWWLKDYAKTLPIICAGDIFDRWNASPELIHFALQNLPDGMICIPGQHDLPNHRMDQMHRCGYGVLKQAGKIVDISGDYRVENGFVVWGFGWDQEIVPYDVKKINMDLLRQIRSIPKVAIIHRYVWKNEANRYQDAPEEASLDALKKTLSTYNAVLIGDNHCPWIEDLPGTSIMNCGTFIRRKSDEIPYKVGIGVLLEDGSIIRKRLDTSRDVFQENAKERESTEFDMKEFIEGLENLGEHGINFQEAVEHALRSNECDAETKEIVLRAIGCGDKNPGSNPGKSK